MPMPWEDHEDDEDTQPGSDNPNFKQLRDYAKKLEKQLTKANKDLESLQTFKVEVETRERQAAVAQVFTEVGLSEKHAALFARFNPEGDVTPETVRSFAEEFELPVKQAGGEQDQPAPDSQGGVDWSKEQIVQTQTGGEPQQKTGFAPVGTQTSTPGAKIITDPDEAMKLYQTNEAEYVRLREAGRIQLETLPGNR